MDAKTLDNMLAECWQEIHDALGAAGCGKTVVMLAKVIQLAKSKKTVVIVTRHDDGGEAKKKIQTYNSKLEVCVVPLNQLDLIPRDKYHVYMIYIPPIEDRLSNDNEKFPITLLTLVKDFMGKIESKSLFIDNFQSMGLLASVIVRKMELIISKCDLIWFMFDNLQLTTCVAEPLVTFFSRVGDLHPSFQIFYLDEIVRSTHEIGEGMIALRKEYYRIPKETYTITYTKASLRKQDRGAPNSNFCVRPFHLIHGPIPRITFLQNEKGIEKAKQKFIEQYQELDNIKIIESAEDKNNLMDKEWSAVLTICDLGSLLRLRDCVDNGIERVGDIFPDYLYLCFSRARVVSEIIFTNGEYHIPHFKNVYGKHFEIVIHP